MLFLIGQGATDDQTRQYASLASGELARVTQITSRMLSFQREAHKPIPVRIQEVLENTVDLWKKKGESAGIQIDLRVDEAGEIVALPGELRQVFANLVGNAVEAMGTKANHGRIRIHAFASRDWRLGRPGLRVLVADNGPGIPVEVRNKIFNPFFTTKGEAGTGLGLWITSDIVRKYEGTMRLRTTTRTGRSGTCFSIFFPLNSAIE
jgi:signal transduction histidine kinase